MSARAYTIIELLIALGIFAIGLTGAAAMQSITSRANRHAKNLAIASHVAESWLDRLAIDSSSWFQDTTSLSTQTEWLSEALGDDKGLWKIPATNAAGDFGASFGALGQFTATTSQRVFCTHIRLTPLFSLVGVANNVDATNNGLIRTDVRVFWPKDETLWKDGANYCGENSEVSIGAASTDFHFVYLSSAVRQSVNEE
jgi:type IV pilus assembly protein PilV